MVVPLKEISIVNLLKLNNPIIKIASFELVDIPLIEYIASKGKPIVMSVGMGSEEEIGEALAACKKYGNEDVVLLKCCSQYPANYEDMNIAAIPLLKEKFGKIVGLSEDYLDRKTNTLSFTEKKKVMLACAMSYNPSVLILEDFEKGLIFRDREYFRKLFLKLKNKFNKTIILISTDITFMFELVDKVYVINKGKIVLSGGKEIYYDDKLYKYIEMPRIVEFTKYAHECGHNILEYTDIKELIKELYRNVK